MATTWDGLPISPDPPYGCAVVVFRRANEELELLTLHRAHHGPTYEGDWAWTPPSGARLPGEVPEDCARRELREETGLTLVLHATDLGTPEWYTYWAEAPAAAPIMIDAEHDRYAWLPPEEAVRRCVPDVAGLALARVAALLREEQERAQS